MFSIVIPTYNEALILESLIEGIVDGLGEVQDFELIIAENGSTDDTLHLAKRCAQHYPQLKVISSPQASYGAAIKNGILESQGDSVIIFNADLWDLNFLHEALTLLKHNDLVIASKRHRESSDQRPANRRFITWAFNRLLWFMFNFQGSDTHGMKAFRRRPLLPIVQRCITEREIFDTELVLRTQQAGLTSIEVPATVKELRPSRYSPLVRLPRTLRDLGLLYCDLYLTRRAEAWRSGSDQL